MNRSSLRMALLTIFLCSLSANVLGCALFACEGLNDFAAHTLSAIIGPAFPLITSPTGTGRSTAWSFSLFGVLVVSGAFLSLRWLSTNIALCAAIISWTGIGLFALFLYRV